MSAARFVVRGKVQGVWFRASARDQAQLLGLRGFARNLADGAVEVVAEGSDAALHSLEAWLRRGPPLASVAGVQREPLPDSAGFDDFEIR